jgi:hypothetical protein
LATARLHTILKERHSILDSEVAPTSRLDVAWRPVYGERLLPMSETPVVQLAATSTVAISAVLLYVVAVATVITRGIEHNDILGVVT